MPPLLITPIEKNILSNDDVLSDGGIESVIELCSQFTANAEAIPITVKIYKFTGGQQGMVVVETNAEPIANYNFDILNTYHALVMHLRLQVAQITSAYVEDMYQGYGLSTLCYEILSLHYVVCSDEHQTLEGAALWNFGIPKLASVKIHVVYQYDDFGRFEIDEIKGNSAWSGDAKLVDAAVEVGIPACHVEDHEKTVFIACSNYLMSPQQFAKKTH